MQYAAAIFSLVAVAVASPTVNTARAITPFGPGNHVVNAICPKLPLPTNGPLPNGFPTAKQLGSIIGPALAKTIGANTVEQIDAVADQLCVSAQQNNEGDGICQNTFAAARAFVNAKTPLGQADEFGCLLNLLCIANAGPKETGTCNKLLGEADCTANTIIGIKPTECSK